MASSSSSTTTTTVRVTRMEEKEELGHLNSRLAVYIEHMKRLKADNSRLTTELKTVTTRHSSSIDELRKQYDGELALARRALDDIAKEKAEFQIKATKFEQRVDELKAQLEEEKAARKKLEEKLNKARLERDAAQSAEKSANAQNKKLRAELEDAERERDEYKSLYEAECIQSEKEALLKVEHENTIQSLREELDFLKQTHAQEINEMRTEVTEIRTSRDTIQVTLKRSYDDALARALQQARERYEEEAEQYRIELRQWYESRTGDDVGRGSGNDALVADLRSEISELRSSNSNVASELKSSRTRIIKLEEQIVSIENRHQALRERYDKDCAEKDARIKELLRRLREKELEYEALMDIRIALDAEIESYRKLLEGEETRLGIESPDRRSVKRKTVADVESLSKRSRQVETETITSSVSIYARTETHGFIHIDELDLDGMYVKITNTSNEDFDITGCVMENTNADDETAQFTIPKSAGVLEAGASTTVWAKDSGEKNDPPSALLWKKHAKFWVGVNCVVRVLSAEGELLSQTMLVEEEEQGELFDAAGDPTEKSSDDKCMIM